MAGKPNHKYEKINRACVEAMVRYNRGPDREKLQRLSVIMDDMVDWDRVKTRRDIITALFQGEVEVRPTTYFVCPADQQ
jgi:hypothetical protein